MMNGYFRILNHLLITVAIYLIVSLLYVITTTRLIYFDFTNKNTQKVSKYAGDTYTPFYNYQTIIERNLFNSQFKTAQPPEKIKIEKLKITNLKLKLLGTSSGGGKGQYAVIENTTERKQGLYKLGSTIQNATIKRILRGKVILSINGRNEILEMDKDQNSFTTRDVNFDLQKVQNQTALIDASKRGHHNTIESLIAEGADINAQDNNGDTALMNASRSGHHKILELLLKEGADVNIKDYRGNTALIHTAKYASDFTSKIVALLVDEGANVNAKNNLDITALMNAARRGHRETVELLIANGADIDAESKNGETALKLAADSLRKDVVALLKDYSAREND